MEWHDILVVGNGDLFMAIMISGLTYYFWGVSSGKIIDKDIKPFKNDDEEEE